MGLFDHVRTILVAIEKLRKPKVWIAKLVPSANKQEVKTVRWLFETYVETDLVQFVKARVVTRAAIGVGEDEIRQVGFSEQTVNS